METTKLYSCESIILMIRFNQALHHFFSNGGPDLIFICEGCLRFFKRAYFPKDFCFKELKKCLVEKLLKKDEGILLPIIPVKENKKSNKKNF